MTLPSWWSCDFVSFGAIVLEAMNGVCTSLKGVMFAAAAITESASEFRGVMRGRFLLGSDMLTYGKSTMWLTVPRFSDGC